MKYIYNFSNPPHRIGDKVAACGMLQHFIKTHTIADKVHIVDFKADDTNSFSVLKYFPDVCRGGYSKHDGGVPKGEYRIIDFNNLWITAPSLFKDKGARPVIRANTSKEFITVHGLYDAPYNVGRNMKKEQVDRLIAMLKDAGLPVMEIPQIYGGMSVGGIIDNYLSKAILCVSGDTGMSHLAAALGKDVIAIYGNDAHDVETYEPLRKQLGASSQWCSDPLTEKLTKFVMVDNEFDVEGVFDCVVKKYKEIMG